MRKASLRRSGGMSRCTGYPIPSAAASAIAPLRPPRRALGTPGAPSRRLAPRLPYIRASPCRLLASLRVGWKEGKGDPHGGSGTADPARYRKMERERLAVTQARRIVYLTMDGALQPLGFSQVVRVVLGLAE